MPRPSPIGRDVMRRVKRDTLLRVMRRERLLSRAELAEHTGLSAATLTGLVRQLMAEGYLIEHGMQPSSGGRPPVLLRYNPRAELVVVVTIEPRGVAVEVVDGDGEPVDSGRARGEHLQATVRLVSRLTDRLSGRLRAVVVSVPGVASGQRGQVRLAPYAGRLMDQPVGDLLTKQLGVPVFVDNDVNLMAAGEHAHRMSAVDNLLLLHVADGIGAGVVIGGRVYRGSADAAGEVGFLPLGAAQAPREGVGAFERDWSARALADRMSEAFGRRPRRPVRELQKLALRDEAAAAMLGETVDAWATAIAACCCVLDPECVLLSGDARDLDDHWRARMSDRVSVLAPGSRVQIRRAELGIAATRYGAVARAFAPNDSGPVESIGVGRRPAPENHESEEPR